MFDEVTKTEGGKNAAKRAGFIFGSTIFQVLLIFVIIWASAIVKAKVIDEPKVDVKFVKVAAPPPPPAPPAPPPPPPAAKPPAERKPPSPNAPRPPPPQALIQPQEVKPEMKVDPNEPKEPDYDYSGSGEGVVGGVVGGVAPVAPPPPPAKVVAAVEDAPVYPTAGYKKAQAADPGCVQTGVVTRMNDTDMERLHGGVVTIQFAVGRDGQTAQFKVLTSGVSDRAKGAIWAAIQSCKWVPGADPSGKPVALLVTLPLRFKQE